MNREDAIKKLDEVILSNFKATFELIKYCSQNKIAGYRFSSSITPLLTHPELRMDIADLPSFKEIKEVCKQIQEYSTLVRISNHPDQFNVLASKNEVAVEKTIVELNHISRIMDLMGLNKNLWNPINIHLNCGVKDGDYKSVRERFYKNYSKLDKNTKRRLTIENEDKPNSWSVLELFKHLHLPILRHYSESVAICFDNLHHKCNPSGLPEEEAFYLAYCTWGGVVPLFHYSESREGKNPRAHADMPTGLPESYGEPCYFDVELKNKEEAVKNILTRSQLQVTV